MEVSELMYNWHQNGSTTESQGAGEDYSFYRLGKNGIEEIKENAKHYVENYKRYKKNI